MELSKVGINKAKFSEIKSKNNKKRNIIIIIIKLKYEIN